MIKSDIEQKAKLIALARALGQEPDAQLVAEVEGYAAFQAEIKENARLSIMQDLQQAIAATKQQLAETLVQEQTAEFPQPPSLEELEHFLSESTAEDEHDLDTETPQEISEPTTSTAQPVAEQSLADLVAQSISAGVKKDSFQQPAINLPAPDVNSLAKKIQQLESWLSKITAHGPGSGEVNHAFMYMPTRTITVSSYNATTKDYYIGVNRTSRANVYLPPYMQEGRTFIIKDELGEASKGTNRHIYIYPPAGEQIDGQDYVILAYDFGSLTFVKRNGFWSVT